MLQFSSLISFLGRTPIGDLPIRIRRGPAAGAIWSLSPSTGYWRGVVEPEMEELLVELDLPQNAVCWDLGAHFGYFSFVLSAVAGSGACVYAFEPDPYNFKKLSMHVARNPSYNIVPIQAAADKESRKLPLLQVKNCSSVSHLPYVGEEIPEDALHITTITLDSLVRDGTVAKPDFVKVDVEGHGAPALEGARESLEATKPLILMSFHSPREVEGACALLQKLGYKARGLASPMPHRDFTKTALFACDDSS